MKYFFEANTTPPIGHKMEDGKTIKEPVKITITVEMEKRKFESLNNKYTEGLAGRILKLFK